MAARFLFFIFSSNLLIFVFSCVEDMPQIVPGAIFLAQSPAEEPANTETPDSGTETPETETPETGTPETPTTPTPADVTVVNSTPVELGILALNGTIRIQFSSELNPGSCSINGATSSLTTGYTDPNTTISYDTTSVTNDTLVLTPLSAPPMPIVPNHWPTRGDQTINIINCTAVSGGTVQNASRIYRVMPTSNVRYVSTSGAPSPTNDGMSPGSPFDNFQDALTSLGSCTGGNCVILATSGTYDENISITNDISILGSWSADFSNVDPSSYATVITPLTCSNNPVIGTGATIHMRSATANTTIRGVTVNASQSCDVSTGIWLDTSSARVEITTSNGPVCTNSTTSGSGIRMNGGTPYINQAVINGGDCSSGLANPNYAGIRITSATSTGARINGSTIRGGTTTGTLAGQTRGIVVLSGGDSPRITYSVIDGGSSRSTAGIDAVNWNGQLEFSNVNGGTSNSQFSTGISLNGGAPTIIHSIIGGGTSITAEAAGILCFGASSPSIYNNTIVGGAANSSSIGIKVGLTTSACSPDITSNILASVSGAQRMCIQQDAGGTPAFIRSNNFFHCETAYQQVFTNKPNICNSGQGFGDSICSGPSVIDPTPTPGTTMVANTRLDPQFVNFADPYDLDLTENTPCQISQGAFDPPPYPNTLYTDRVGNARTGLFSMGAFEYDGPCVP